MLFLVSSSNWWIRSLSLPAASPVAIWAFPVSVVTTSCSLLRMPLAARETAPAVTGPCAANAGEAIGTARERAAARPAACNIRLQHRGRILDTENLLWS
jgi:hypothetical protein